MPEAPAAVRGRSGALAAIAICYVIGLGLRFVPLARASGGDDSRWNGERIIATEDGYYWGSLAQKALYGMHGSNPMLPEPESNLIPVATSFLVGALGLKLESVMYFLSAIVSPLVVVPIILIGSLYAELFRRRVLVAFGAIIACASGSYYGRTALGCFDTDMLALTAPLLAAYFLLKYRKDGTPRPILHAALVINFIPFLYNSGMLIVYALLFVFALQVLVADGSRGGTWKALAVLALSLIEVPALVSLLGSRLLYLAIRAIVLIAAHYIASRAKERRLLSMCLAVAFLAAFLVFNAPIQWAIWKVGYYLGRDSAGPALGYSFFPVESAIEEARPLGMRALAALTAGSPLLFLAAAIGYVVMCYRRRELLLLLPFLAMGAFSSSGGVRFALYLAPVAGLSLAFVSDAACGFALRRLGSPTPRAAAAIGRLAPPLALLCCMIPSVAFLLADERIPVTEGKYIGPLAELGRTAKGEGYVITDWGYGNTVWFYSGLKTLHAPSLVTNNVYLSSIIFRSPSPLLAANLCRLAVYGCERNKKGETGLEYILKEFVADKGDFPAFLSSLGTPGYRAPDAGNGDIYLYFHYGLMRSFPTMMRYSDVDIVTGKMKSPNLFALLERYQAGPRSIRFDGGAEFDWAGGTMLFRGASYAVKRLMAVDRDEGGATSVETATLREDGTINLLYYAPTGAYIVADEEMYRSLFFQLYLLGNFDERYFEICHDDPFAKIYKLRTR